MSTHRSHTWIDYSKQTFQLQNWCFGQPGGCCLSVSASQQVENWLSGTLLYGVCAFFKPFDLFNYYHMILFWMNSVLFFISRDNHHMNTAVSACWNEECPVHKLDKPDHLTSIWMIIKLKVIKSRLINVFVLSQISQYTPLTLCCGKQNKVPTGNDS